MSKLPYSNFSAWSRETMPWNHCAGAGFEDVVAPGAPIWTQQSRTYAYQHAKKSSSVM